MMRTARNALVALAIVSVAATPTLADDPAIDQSGNVAANVEVLSGHTVTSTQAGTAAIKIGGGQVKIDAGGTVQNTGSGGTGIAVGNTSSTITNLGRLIGTNGVAVAGGTANDTVILGDGSSTTGILALGTGTNTVSFTGGGNLTGTITGASTITKSGSGTFVWKQGAETTGAALNVTGGTLNVQSGGIGILTQGNSARITDSRTTITGGGTLQISDGVTLATADKAGVIGLAAGDATSAGNLVVGSGGTTALVASTGTATFRNGSTFTINQGGTFTAETLNILQSSAQVGGSLKVTTALNMTDSLIHITSTGSFSDEFTAVSTLNNSFITVDAGGQLKAKAVYNNTPLKINGTLNGDVTLGPGSVLSGTGLINGLVTVGDGATISPGNSPGTISIAAVSTPMGLILTPGSTTRIEVGSTTSDLIAVTGGATLAGTLQLVQADLIRASRTVNIITATGGITGAFGTITGQTSSPIFSFVTTMPDAKTLAVTVTRNKYEPFALSENQRGPAANLDTYLTGTQTSLDGLVAALDAQPTAQALAAALDQLHAEMYDVHAQIMFQQQQLFAGQMEQYLRTTRLNLGKPGVALATPAGAGPAARIAPAIASGSIAPGAVAPESRFEDPATKMGSFGFVYGTDGDNTTLRNGLGAVTRTGFDLATHGVVGGIDRRVNDKMVVGLTFGAGTVVSDLREARGRIDADDFQVGAYSTWKHKDWYVDSLLNYTHYDFRTLRGVVFPGIQEAERANHEGRTLTSYTGIGLVKRHGDWEWGPTASLQYTHDSLDQVVETGGLAALAVGSRTVNSLRSQLGVRITRAWDYHGCHVVPELRLRWAHEFEADDRAINARFNLATLPTFTSLAASPDRDSAFLGGSVSAYFRKNLDGFLSYDADLGRQGSTLHTARAGLAVKF